MPAFLRPQRAGLLYFAALVQVTAAGCTTDFDLSTLSARDSGVDASSDLGDVSLMDVRADAPHVDNPPPPPPPPDAGCGMDNQLCCAGDASTRCAPTLICTSGACLRCPGMLTACGETCVDLSVNPRYCGRCETRCMAGEVCTGGACVLPCPAGQAQCGSECVQIASDVLNCGACGTACVRPAHAASQCMSRRCETGACDPGYANCDGNLANGCESALATSPMHCGACGNSCTFAHAEGSCVAGACVIGACEAGFGNCDMNSANGCEVNVATSVTHCGTCGTVCPSGGAGSAVCRMSVCGTSTTVCEPGMGDCDGNLSGCETDLNSSVNNCGACGASCSFAHAAVTCAAGVCVMGACEVGFGNCDGESANGCETDLRSSTSHCGSCPTVCVSAHGAAECSASLCRLGACEMGFGNCDMNPANGCEADLSASAGNCGGCGVVCTIPNAMSTCTAGACRLVMCNSGFADCDGNPGNGCEVALMTDPSNCGACRSVCNSAHATPTCVAGACAPVCEAGFGNCDMNPANGCEADLRNDPAHCGACSPPCNFSHAVATCVGSACAMGACEAGFANCDGNPANGCEVDLQSSPVSCGACSNACASGQLCSAGACTVSCGAGFMACGTSCVDLQSNSSNCGACGNLCPSGSNAVATCSAGRCGLTCASGFSDCDMVPGNGCEVNTATNALNCGGCGRACSAANAVSSCVASACALTCNPGFGNCDNDSANGCEIVTSTNASNCGACGNPCPTRANATPICTSGACGFTCSAGFGDCDGTASNGCETDLRTNAANCGACGTRCGFPNARSTCVASACVIGACVGGYGNCDGSTANGCEERLSVIDHCGSCTTVCPSPTNARSACNFVGGARVCATSCLSGYSNCAADGSGACATNLRTTSRCGACSGSGSSCSGGSSFCRSNVSSSSTGSPSCGNSSCPSGTSLCATPQQCVNFQTDPANCGSCGNVCPGAAHAIPSCSSGSCRLSCIDVYNNCNSMTSDGCESNRDRDRRNCGACGASCNTGEFCSSGRCCPNNQFNCNGVCVDLHFDDANCGACANVCTGGQHCVNDACRAS